VRCFFEINNKINVGIQFIELALSVIPMKMGIHLCLSSHLLPLRGGRTKVGVSTPLYFISFQCRGTMNRAHLICHSHSPIFHSHENGNLSFLIIMIEPPIKQHIQTKFTKFQKIFKKFPQKRKIFKNILK